MADKKISQHELAKQLGLSPATVSLVLNGKVETIPANTRRKVLEAAAEHGFFPEGGITQNSDTDFIAYLSQPSDEYHREFVEGIEKVLSSKSWFLVQTTFQRELFFNHLLPHIKGCIIRERLDETLIATISEKVPVVLLNNSYGGRYTEVTSSDEAGIEEAVNHFVKKGHSKVAYFCIEPTTEKHEARRNGYKRRMSECNLGVEGMEFVYRKDASEMNGRHYKKYVEIFIKQFINMPKASRPTAIIFASSLYGTYFSNIALHFGIKIPMDVSIIGYDYLAAGDMCYPAFSYIEQPLVSMGSEAARLLLSKIENPDELERKVELSPKLQLSESLEQNKK